VIGLDTGFFFLLSDADSAATHLLERITETDEDAAVSSIAIYEVVRHGMRGALPSNVVDLLIDNVADAFTLAGVDDLAVLRRAAGIRHGMGIHMADALIAASLERVGCTVFYTTNGADFERYNGPMTVRLLRSS
jgi:predicted nucleic acid-binding protein